MANLPPAEAIGPAYKNLLNGGARAMIFAQYPVVGVNTVAGVDANMPCVLVDYEIAHRIASYSTRTR